MCIFSISLNGGGFICMFFPFCFRSSLVSYRLFSYSVSGIYTTFVYCSFSSVESSRVESRVNQDVIETFSVNAFMPLLGFHHQQSAWLQQDSKGSVWCLEIVRASFSCFNFVLFQTNSSTLLFRGREPG